MNDPMKDALLATGLDLPHAFFTRTGGVSGGAYASLNCGMSSQDDPAAVRQNRARAAQALGAAPADLLGLAQVHGIAVATATQAWRPGEAPRADAVVTNCPGLALGIVTADCAPILLADAEAGVIGAAHAGWRGAAAGVIEATVAAMAALGARRAAIAAAIGPCIRQPSYEVGADLFDAVRAQGNADGCFAPARFFKPGRSGPDGPRWQFDLAGYCAVHLAAAGVTRVDTIAADTLPDDRRFFSHRRRTLAGGGPIGHQISIITLPAT